MNERLETCEPWGIQTTVKWVIHEHEILGMNIMERVREQEAMKEEVLRSHFKVKMKIQLKQK